MSRNRSPIWSSPLPAAEPSLPERRRALQLLGGLGLAVGLGWPRQALGQVAAQVEAALVPVAGGGANPHWNGVGPLVSLPQKVPLIQLADRPVQLETPRPYFLSTRTPNAAFFVRWHLPLHPRAVDLASFRLRVEGAVERPLALSFAELVRSFSPQTVVAVNQCAGNGRSRFVPRVAGSQWGNGAMGCAEWTGVRLRELLSRAGLRRGALCVQLEGLDRGAGPAGHGSAQYLKSLDLAGDGLDDALVAYAMNGEPLPLLNGFPLRLVVPGYFATYWVKSLSVLRVLTAPDQNFWMKSAYRAPTTPNGSTSPEAVARGEVQLAPLSRMPVRSFLVTPDGSSRLPSGLPVQLRGLAFSGHGRVATVEVSVDDGQHWAPAELGSDDGAYAFRAWSFRWVPGPPGRQRLAVRATDSQGGRQLDQPVWNPSGYLWSRIERQEVMVGQSS